MNAIDDRWVLAADFLWLCSLAQAGGRHELARDCWIVGVDWLAGAQERTTWRPPWLALA